MGWSHSACNVLPPIQVTPGEYPRYSPASESVLSVHLHKNYSRITLMLFVTYT